MRKETSREKRLVELEKGFTVPQAPPPSGEKPPEPTKIGPAPLTVGEPLLVVSSLANGRTDWTYVRRALAPATIGAIPEWMKAILLGLGPHTSYNPEGVAIPGELDDNG
jgi:hypothetical protein